MLKFLNMLFHCAQMPSFRLYSSPFVNFKGNLVQKKVLAGLLAAVLAMS